MRQHFSLAEKTKFAIQIKEMLDKGMKIEDIAKELGIKTSAAYTFLRENRLRKNGLDPKTPVKVSNNYNEDLDIEIQKLRAENRMLREKLGAILLERELNGYNTT